MRTGKARRALGWLRERGEKSTYEEAEEAARDCVTVSAWLARYGCESVRTDNRALENMLIGYSQEWPKIVVGVVAPGAQFQLVFEPDLIHSLFWRMRDHREVNRSRIRYVIKNMKNVTPFANHIPFPTVREFASERGLNSVLQDRLEDLACATATPDSVMQVDLVTFTRTLHWEPRFSWPRLDLLLLQLHGQR